MIAKLVPNQHQISQWLCTHKPLHPSVNIAWPTLVSRVDSIPFEAMLSDTRMVLLWCNMFRTKLRDQCTQGLAFQRLPLSYIYGILGFCTNLWDKLPYQHSPEGRNASIFNWKNSPSAKQIFWVLHPTITNVLSIIDPLQQVQHCGIGTLELLGLQHP